MKSLTGFLLLVFLMVPHFSRLPGMEQITVSLSNPQKPGLISLAHYKGSVYVTGYSGKAVVVSASYRHPQTSRDMKIHSSTALKLSAIEKDNIVRISTHSHRKTLDIRISVPYHSSLKISTDTNGDIIINGVWGEFELNNKSGDIKLTGVSGSAVISALEGNITAEFRKVIPGLPMVLTTIEGRIDLSLPADINASLKMKTEFGEIYSDFDIDIKKPINKLQKKGRKRGWKVDLADWTLKKINQGGAEYLIKSLNGDIRIRKNQ